MGETCATWTNSPGSVSIPWRFQSRLLETVSGQIDLDDFGARRCDPSLGAFTSLDSTTGNAQNPLTLNRYLYAGADPTTLSTPMATAGASASTSTPVGALQSVASTVTTAASGVVDTVSHMDPSTITHTVLGVATFVPVLGTAAAIADAGLYTYEGDYLSAGLSMAGVIPGGAILKYGGKALRVAEDAEKAATVVRNVERADRTVNDIERVERVAKDADEGERAARQVAHNYSAGNEASDRIASRYSKAEREVTRQTSEGPRRLDVFLRREATEIESKVGRTSLTSRVRQETRRNALLLADSHSGVDHVIWEFSRSAVTGKGGPTSAVIRQLENVGISWVHHLF